MAIRYQGWRWTKGGCQHISKRSALSPSWFIPWMASLERSTMVRGSIAKANSKGESGQPCLDPRCFSTLLLTRAQQLGLSLAEDGWWDVTQAERFMCLLCSHSVSLPFSVTASLLVFVRGIDVLNTPNCLFKQLKHSSDTYPTRHATRALFTVTKSRI